MPRPLPRFDAAQQKAADVQQVERIVAEVEGAAAPGAKRIPGASHANLRGLPAIGRNVSGAIAGSDPLRALLARERRRRR